ncbi:SLC13 family permease [Enemella evansiae]|uniref:SLC13 family permease n=1 Tax=Enemella evansiae TaxID=2016499 RepID=UPI000B96045E|nr:SLC13 family permease [Enemella evansiae]OYO01405.1 hypothetical protein CGZ97_18530 [Enemella evansiae]
MTESRWRLPWLRRPPWGWSLLAAGALAVLTGLVPTPAAAHAWDLGWPVLLFLILVKPVADLCQVAGLFRVAADALARLARGSGGALFWLFTGLATLTTVFLSLDTTAVLLAPIGVVLARRLRLDPLPYAFAAIWLANSASLLLPVSNLTNLMAHQRLGSAYLAQSWLPQLGVLAVTLLVLGLRWGRRVAGAYAPPPVEPIADRVLLVASAVVAVALGPLLVLGVPAWAVAAGGLAVLWSTAALRRHPEARVRPMLALFPFEVAAGVLGLFWLVAGFSDRLAGWLPTPDTGIAGNLLVAGIAALAANAVNNLPAFLALEGWAGTPQQLLALLVGVNVGPTILLWGSLANLLWWQSIRRLGVHVGVRRFAAEGLLLVPVAVLVGALLVGA